MKFGTKAIHAGQEPDPSTGAIMTPVYQTSTYVQSSPGKHKGYEYARTQNPTRSALEANLAALENAKYARCFGSGLAATDTVMKLLNPGDEVVCTNDLYGGTYRLFTSVYAKYGIKFHFIDMLDLQEVEKVVSDKTKMIWLETPTNPMLQIIDIKSVTEIAKRHEALTVVDNTFASPYLQNPIDLNADVVVHSLTKYIAGHSDAVMGAVITNNTEIHERLAYHQNAVGAIPGPMDCFLVLRGIKTLHLRMQRHCENGAAVAQYLKKHPKVAKVHYPGFSEHKNHEIAARQMKDFGGMVSFSLKEDKKEAAFKFLEGIKVFSLAESLGGVESLAGHPSTMTHASIPAEERIKSGITDSLIRLSVGVEDIEDLLEDLENALS
ncbi:MAG: cystathionine gamma-synthase [Cyclobacteriaceae bacterium]